MEETFFVFNGNFKSLNYNIHKTKLGKLRKIVTNMKGYTVSLVVSNQNITR
jgi:hypothetical protein